MPRFTWGNYIPPSYSNYEEEYSVEYITASSTLAGRSVSDYSRDGISRDVLDRVRRTIDRRILKGRGEEVASIRESGAYYGDKQIQVLTIEPSGVEEDLEDLWSRYAQTFREYRIKLNDGFNTIDDIVRLFAKEYYLSRTVGNMRIRGEDYGV